MNERHRYDLVPGDLVSFSFSKFPILRHYGIVAKNISYVYDFSEDSNKTRIKVQKRKLEEFSKQESFRIEPILNHKRKDRIITLERAAILTRIYKKTTLKETTLAKTILSFTDSTFKYPKLTNWVEKILQVIPFNNIEYSWMHCNCEHVATWCKIGKWNSDQIKNLSSFEWHKFVYTQETLLEHLKSILSHLSDFLNISFNHNNQRNNNYYVRKYRLLLEYTFYHFLFQIELIFREPEFRERLKINIIKNEKLIKASKDLLRFDKTCRITIVIALICFGFYSIYQHKTIDSSTRPTNPQVRQSPLDNNNIRCSYEVKRGDTLETIAKKFYDNKNKWEDIRQKNKRIIKDKNVIREGELLIIPVDDNNRPNFPTENCSKLKK